MNTGNVTFMKTLISFIILSLCACDVSYDTASIQSSVTTDPFHWMVGTWDCASGYHTVGPYKTHSAIATYVVTDNVTALDDVNKLTTLNGHYEESSTSDDSPLSSFDDAWSIGIVDSSSTSAPVDITVTNTDGTFSGGSGTDQIFPTSKTLIGSVSISGDISTPGSTTTSWRFSILSVQNPTHFTSNWSLGIGGGALQVYLGMTCTLRM